LGAAIGTMTEQMLKLGQQATGDVSPRGLASLYRLKLSRVPECLDQLTEVAAKEQWTYVEFLERLLETEVSARVERDVLMKTRLARFPFVKSLDQFDFTFQPALNEAQIRELPPRLQ
jgi:DNA replication protein DnaC